MNRYHIPIILLFTLIIFISGCDQQVPETQEETPQLEIVTKLGKGIVNRDEIGGNELFVVSAHTSNSKVGGDGKFTTVVSSEGAQIIFVEDEQKRLRATAISLPQYAENIVFDATSTAKVSIFFTPGILAVDPSEAESTLNKIDQLYCFPDLVSFYRNRLYTNSINDLNLPMNEEYNALLERCINEIRE